MHIASDHPKVKSDVREDGKRLSKGMNSCFKGARIILYTIGHSGKSIE